MGGFVGASPLGHLAYEAFEALFLGPLLLNDVPDHDAPSLSGLGSLVSSLVVSDDVTQDSSSFFTDLENGVGLVFEGVRSMRWVIYDRVETSDPPQEGGGWGYPPSKVPQGLMGSMDVYKRQRSGQQRKNGQPVGDIG